LPTLEGSIDFHEVGYNWLCKYGDASEDEDFNGDDNEDHGDDVYDLYYNDDGGDEEEVDDDDEYIHYGFTFTWKFDDLPTNSNSNSDNYKPSFVEKDL